MVPRHVCRISNLCTKNWPLRHDTDDSAQLQCLIDIMSGGQMFPRVQN